MKYHLLGSVTAFLIPSTLGRTCGNTEVPISLLEHAISSNRLGITDSSRNQTIIVHFHNVFINQTEVGGYISNETMEKQWSAMNDHFSSTGISFDLKNVTHTENKSWALSSRNTTTELNMRKALRKGGYDELNVYFRPVRSYLGRCSFPADVVEDSDEFWRDGCDVLHTTVPGGSKVNYNEGKTATHEVGHWLGLFHTFQGGCDGGDLVDDTPAQASPTRGCPLGKDTCRGPKYPGLDPIHNYMDYSYDSCLTEFTPGQTVRIYQNWDRYRNPNV